MMVWRGTFAAGHTRTSCESPENANTPTPRQSIQCKLSRENNPANTFPESSNQSLTLRPVLGATPSAKAKVNVACNGLARRFYLSRLSRVAGENGDFSATSMQHFSDRSDRFHGGRFPRAFVPWRASLFIERSHAVIPLF